MSTDLNVTPELIKALRAKGLTVIDPFERPDFEYHDHGIIYDVSVTYNHDHANHATWMETQHKNKCVMSGIKEATALVGRLNFIKRWSIRAVELQPKAIEKDQTYWTPHHCSPAINYWTPSRYTTHSPKNNIVSRRLSEAACKQLCVEMNQEVTDE
jgi:hypothetical protein